MLFFFKANGSIPSAIVTTSFPNHGSSCHAEYTMPWEICPWLFQVITSLLKSILLTQESKDHHLPFLEPISEEGKFSLFILMNLCFGARSTMDV